MGIFVLNKEDNTYAATIDGVEFVCEEATPEFERIAPALAQAYQEKLPRLIESMMDDVTEMFGFITADELKDALGTPQVDLDRDVVTYFEHTLDDGHIIEVEFGGMFDEIYEVSIDG